jgi:monooxygenase
LRRKLHLCNQMEHFDVIIVGAGLSGIGAARHLQDKLPGKSYLILESRGAIGGTWDLFRYPGIRSDSDMHTLGYVFRPWQGAKAIADGPSIRHYIRDTATEAGIDARIRLRHRVERARWSSEQARWTLSVRRAIEGDGNGGDPASAGEETIELSCSFLFCCTGYYRYDRGYQPEFAGLESFRGRVVHPQHWPEDLDYEGKRVVVVGSGSTAVTLVPAMAQRAAHVTMLQRTPTYIVSLPAEDPLANAARRWLPAKLAYRLTRAKNVAMMLVSFQASRRWPELVKRLLRAQTRRQLPDEVDVDVHFKPPYNPWDQRLCVVPDGDLFRALRERRVSILTDRIDTFTPDGLRLLSGGELAADIIVTATGLDLLVLGGIELEVDGEQVSIPERIGYRGMMLSDVPNMAIALGYTNASWTLKCDLTCDYVCRLLAHMDANGYDQVTPRLKDPSVRPLPFIDLRSGYVQRAMERFPKQGSKPPWRLRQNYLLDRIELSGARFDEGLEFRSARRAATPALLAS